jgi:LPXTG-motif cell wall-anchored protein
LFDPGFLWVPGDDEESSFYVRNQGPSGANLTVFVRSTDTDKLVADDALELWVRSGGGSWMRLQNGAGSTVLASGSAAEGSVTRVDVRVRFDPASVNQSETKALRLNFIITLTQAVPGGSDESDSSDHSDNSDDSDGRLPGTGSTGEPQWMWFAAGLISGGLALVGASRRKERADV